MAGFYADDRSAAMGEGSWPSAQTGETSHSLLPMKDATGGEPVASVDHVVEGQSRSRAAAAAGGQGREGQGDQPQRGRLGDRAEDDVVEVDGLGGAVAVDDEAEAEERVGGGHVVTLGGERLGDGPREHLPAGELRAVDLDVLAGAGEVLGVVPAARVDV